MAIKGTLGKLNTRAPSFLRSARANWVNHGKDGQQWRPLGRSCSPRRDSLSISVMRQIYAGAEASSQERCLGQHTATDASHLINGWAIEVDGKVKEAADLPPHRGHY